MCLLHVARRLAIATAPTRGSACRPVRSWTATSRAPITANLGHTGYAPPNLVGDPEVENPSAERWFNPAAFAVPVNTFGNAGRNILRTPGYWNVDVGLQRNIRLMDTKVVSLRAEVFNVFNHINLGNPAVAIDNPARVARITSMSGSPRQIQFGLRLTY